MLTARPEFGLFREFRFVQNKEKMPHQVLFWEKKERRERQMEKPYTPIPEAKIPKGNLYWVSLQIKEPGSILQRLQKQRRWPKCFLSFMLPFYFPTLTLLKNKISLNESGPAYWLRQGLLKTYRRNRNNIQEGNAHWDLKIRYFYPVHCLSLIVTRSKGWVRGFPGGAVVENLPANAGDTDSSPGLGRSHMPLSS